MVFGGVHVKRSEVVCLTTHLVGLAWLSDPPPLPEGIPTAEGTQPPPPPHPPGIDGLQ